MSTMKVQELGSPSSPPILFIHGWTMSAAVEQADFEPIFNAPPLDYRRIYVDLPGMGGSPAAGIRNLDDIFTQLAHFIDIRLPAPQRFLLAGSSCGAYLARAVVARYRERVDGVLFRVPLVEPRDNLRDVDSFRVVVQNEEVMSSLSAADRRLLGSAVPVQTPQYVSKLKNKIEHVYFPAEKAADNKVLDPIRADPERYCLSFELDGGKETEGKEGEGEKSEDTGKGSRKVDVPTLIICGRNDTSVGYRDAFKLLDKYPRATFVVLDRAGHDLPVDQETLFGELVQEWVRRVEEWRRTSLV